MPTAERTLWRGAMSLDIGYVFGLASNSRLVRMTLATQEKALAEYEHLQQPVTWYRSVCYKTLGRCGKGNDENAKMDK